MDGKGTIKEIFTYTCFSFAPFILINIPLTVISNYLTRPEGSFYYGFLSIAIFWSLLLLFFGTLVTHDYSLTKTLLTIICIIFGIGFVLFLGILFISLWNTLVNFFTDIYKEIVYRM